MSATRTARRVPTAAIAAGPCRTMRSCALSRTSLRLVARSARGSLSCTGTMTSSRSRPDPSMIRTRTKKMTAGSRSTLCGDVRIVVAPTSPSAVVDWVTADLARTARSRRASASASCRSAGMRIIKDLRRNLRFGSEENGILKGRKRLADLLHAPGKAGEDGTFGRISGKQVAGMNRMRLTEAIHPPDALLAPDRIPGQLEIDHQAAPALKVEAFGACIGSQEHVGGPVVERLNSAAAFVSSQAAVKENRASQPSYRGFEREQRVPVLGEDNRGLVDAAQNFLQHPNLPLVRACTLCSGEDLFEGALFLIDSIEDRRGERWVQIRNIFFEIKPH